MQSRPILLTTAEEISELAEVLNREQMIAFDTEFIRESTFFPIVEIIQVATDKESWLVDAKAFKKNVSALQPLLDVFKNTQILKVVHAAQGDQECLYTSFGTIASPTLDTAVAASLCGYGDGIGLGNLLQSVLKISLAKGHARTNWSVRPLPKHLIEYAHSDVKFLVALGKQLLEQLESLGRREWALRLSAQWEDKTKYEPEVGKMAEKLARGRHLDKRAYAALFQLVKWREERVRQLDLPRRWLADDQVLLDLAQVRPEDMAHLSTFRGLNKGELKSHGEVILKALRDVGEFELDLPKPVKASVPTPQEAHVLEFLKCYIHILADRHHIAAKYLMTPQQLLPILRNRIENCEDLKKLGILSEEISELIGEDLIAMVRGRRTLRIHQGMIKMEEISVEG